MSKNTISTFSLILLIGVVMWFFHMNRQADEEPFAQELQTDEDTTSQAVAASTPTPRPTPRATRSISPIASRVSGELQQLEQQLAEAQENLEAQRQSYNELNSRSQILAARAPASDNTINVLRSESQVQNNLMEMDSYRNLEEQINRQAEDQIRQQNSYVQMQLSQIDENIRTQTALIQQTREDIDYWRLNFAYATEQQAQLERLNNLLAAQNEQLDLMLQQRTLVSAEALSATQAIQLQKQQALAGVAADRNDAQGEVESLRDSIIRLQQSQREIRNSQVSVSSQLRQAQASLQNQETQVKSLESAIEQKKQELDSLVQ